MAGKLWFLHALGVVIRCCLVHSSLPAILKSCVEVSTPMNSWKRVVEGVFLHERGIDPYTGDIYHEMCDFATALCLAQVANEFAKEMMTKQKLESHSYAKDTSPMYLFNPYVILNCLAMTTTVFSNFALAACLLCSMRGQRLGATWFLALATYQSFYPVTLIVPVSMYIAEVEGIRLTNYKSRAAIKSILYTSFLFVLWCIGLLILSFELMENWNFLPSIYGFLLLAPDLAPSIGLFWYFFTEMFDHFRLFFTCTFQINAFIYLLPLAIKLKKMPMLLYFMLCCLSAVFKSYPSIGDVGFYMSLLPLFAYLSKHMRQAFLISGIFLACSVLLPITRYLWLYAGSANSNFYFSINLAFATGQIFLATDLLFAYLKRDFHLTNGVQITIDGEPAKIVLQ
uniref:Phosphatidylinositol glycan anchor biosynthesis class U protein n=1 Tax=Strigamia maritima TaxID=126957 RepID=T1J4W4_STRMM